ncbi:hypothetical protein [Mycoplasmoides pirum]|uniref:hypothetical protein n=1 Tax=Mycoplasmoides pirum TaxID=2122 RepID=UPI00048669C2|nr:hypothetical protein [Mycoplasmoides pirum]
MSLNQWNPSEYINSKIQSIRKKVGNNYVICLVNSDLNSAILASILNQALGPQVRFLFIDTGLISINEEEKVDKLFNEFLKLKVIKLKSNDLFFNNIVLELNKENKDSVILNTFMEVFCDFINELDIPIYCVADGTLFTTVYKSEDKQYIEYIQAMKDLNLLILQPLRNLERNQILDLAKFLNLPMNVAETNWNSIYGCTDAMNSPITKKKLELYSKIQDLYTKELHKNKLSVLNTRCLINFLTNQSLRYKTFLKNEFYISLSVVDLSINKNSNKINYLNFPINFWSSLSKNIKNEIPEIKGVSLDLIE